jgi:hypothetical protein
MSLLALPRDNAAVFVQHIVFHRVAASFRLVSIGNRLLWGFVLTFYPMTNGNKTHITSLGALFSFLTANYTTSTPQGVRRVAKLILHY